MSIKRTETGWLVDIQPNGRSGKRYRKKFDQKAEAMQFAAWVTSQNTTKQEPWQPRAADKRTIDDLIKIYDEAYAITLKDKVKRISTLKNTFKNFTGPAIEYTAKKFIEYRAQRTDDGIKMTTVNNELAYAKAMFNKLMRIGEWTENPLKNVQPVKIDEFIPTFLTIDESKNLIKKLEGEAQLIAKISLQTGGRFGEIHELEKSQISHGKITFGRTKSKKSRAIPICTKLETELREHCKNRNQIFEGSYDGIYDSIEKGLEKIEAHLPRGQNIHVLNRARSKSQCKSWSREEHRNRRGIVTKSSNKNSTCSRNDRVAKSIVSHSRKHKPTR